MEKNSEYYFNNGKEAWENNKFKDAKKYFEKAIELNPNYASAYNNLGVLLSNYYFKGYETSKKYFEKAIELNPIDASAYNNLGILLSNNYFRKYEASKKYFEKAIELNPIDANAYNNLGALLNDYFKEYEASKKYFEKAIELNPNYANAYNNLGILYIKYLNNPEKGIEYFKKANQIQEKQIQSTEKERKQIKAEEQKLNYLNQKQIKLQSVNLKNIGHFEDIQINFNEKITCIIAENGLGKTSILTSIAVAISGINANSILNNREYEAYSIIRKKLKIEKIKDELIDEKLSTVYIKEGQIKLDYKIDKKPHCNEIHFLKPEGIENIKVSDNSDDENSFAINTGKNGNYFHNLILGFPQGQVRYKSKDLGFQKDLRPNISDIYNLITGSEDDKLISFSKWINKVYSENGQNIKHHQITKIFEIISKIVSSENENAINLKSIKLDDFGDPVLIVTTPENPNGIPIELLSQGLTNVFTWICYFMQRIYEHYGEFVNIEKIHAIVIIDEIDKYLHPKWQKKILQVLLEFFKKTQFIITTHSPLVLMGLERKQIARIKLKNDKAFVEYNDDFNVWGWEFQDVLERFMLKFDTSEYNLKAEENKLKLLKKQGVDEIKIADLEEKIMRIKESYEAEGELGKYKIQRNKAEGELKEQNKFLFELVKKLKKENEQLKS